MKSMNRAALAAVAACALAVLAACGGGGGNSGSGGGNNTGSGGTSGGSSPYVLFASDFSGNVAAFTTLSPAAGTTVSGNLVETVQYTGNTLAYDAVHDELYMLYENTFATPSAKLEVFAHASSLKSGAAPARTVVLPDLFGAERMVLDTTHDRLWISGSNNDHLGIVAVYDHASTLTGSASVSRTLAVSTQNMALDAARDVLYLNPAVNEIHVFAGASTLDGAVRPDRVIRGMDSTDSLVLDASRDTLYAVASGSASIYVMHGASTATSVTPSTIALPAGAYLVALAVDSAHDRLYAGGQEAAYIIDNVSTLGAGAAPAVKVQAPGSVVAAFAFAGQ
jgi:hypothetical protein